MSPLCRRTPGTSAKVIATAPSHLEHCCEDQSMGDKTSSHNEDSSKQSVDPFQQEQPINYIASSTRSIEERCLRKVVECDNYRIMSNQDSSPITTLLKRTIVDSGIPYKALERETGVKRSSIQRFVDGRQSIRLDMADRLAAYFGLELREGK